MLSSHLQTYLRGRVVVVGCSSSAIMEEATAHFEVCEVFLMAAQAGARLRYICEGGARRGQSGLREFLGQKNTGLLGCTVLLVDYYDFVLLAASWHSL